MKNILTALVLCSCIALGNAPRTLSHAVAPASQAPRLAASGDTLRILAVMVQFQTDTDNRTSGNGRFDLSDSVQRIIDAPPRDSAYFADHFRFAKNYYQKVSNGRQPIAATVMGQVMTLPNKMQAYAPSSGSNIPLTRLVEDAWHAADSLNPGFPFGQYQLFVIFHAGSGKDIDLRGSLGYDPTPYDLPSIYFNLPAMQKLRGASFQGVRTGGGFLITNSAILPETENRMVPGTPVDYLLQLGINGLVVANIASHLGLPDLFDTKSGRTAIGRFGLMDGQSIFSFSGLFPPAPSAWERVRLGWALPVLASSASGARLSAGSDTVVKVPISAKEYFLLENRQRDRNRDGQTLTIRWRGQEFTKKFSQDEDHFNYASVDSIYGTIVDVDEVDWSLPGVINQKNMYPGGILIWHIDETVIDRNLPANSINADENRRGVDLVEADGSQDIGQSYGFIDPGSGSEEGSPLDYWFKGNVAPVYKNEFSETTTPNSLSNSKAHSHVTIGNFSASGPVMTFDVQAGDAAASLVGTVKRGSVWLDNNDAPVFADLNGDGADELIYKSNDSVFVRRNDLSVFAGNPSALFAPRASMYQPAVIRGFDATGIVYAALVRDSTVGLYSMTASGTAKLERAFNVGAQITTPVYSRVNDKGVHELAVGTSNNRIAVITAAGVTSVASPVSHIASLAFDGMAWTAAPGMFLETVNERGVAALASFSSGSGVSTVRVYTDNTVVIEGAIQRTWKMPSTVTGALAVFDLNGDGANDLLIGTMTGLYAYTTTGALIENFPLVPSDGGGVSGSPLVLKKKDGTQPLICFGSTKGHVYAYTADGKLVSGFPLQTSGVYSAMTASGTYLAAASSDSSVYVWNVGGLFADPAASWNGYLGGASHTNMGVQPASGVQKSDELLPSKLAYNWPNPVYDKVTHIRYYLGKAAAVTVKIFTMAGERVATLHGSGDAHTDNEIDWDVSDVQSGVYLAQIEAESGGEKHSTLIKIAVVK
ncbi:MAG: T9SS type A sorting domain-containing protein [Acidobacteriota bacterium]